jgi:tetratricopeptide (TPR) repeat protein
VSLTPQEQAHFASPRQVDPHAYEAYLKGRYHWNRRTGDGLPKAARYFQEAISQDPSFAAAYSGLADSLSGLGIFGFVSPSEGFGKAKDLAMRALELDPGLSEAHASRAWTLLWYDFDFPKAEREFERAIELDSRYATAHGWFGWYLALMGRYEEAYTECQRALRLEPLSSAMQYALGCIYWMAHRYDQAIEHLERALDFEPNFSWSHGFIGFAYQGKCMYEPAVAALQRAVELSPRSTLSLLGLAEAYALAGKRDEARKIVDQVDKLSSEQYVTPYFRARVDAALGEQDNALDWLEASCREQMSHSAFLKVDPHFDSLRSEPRFQELVRRMKFPT